MGVPGLSVDFIIDVEMLVVGALVGALVATFTCLV